MTIRAAGAVVWRPGGEVLVVHRPRYDDWSLPKGKLHKDEEPLLAARREIAEETGCEVALGPYLMRSHYRVTEYGEPVEKTVDWWVARLGSETPRPPDEEVDAHEWLPLDEAVQRVSWDTDREVLARFRRVPVPTSTVLLVRHAHAGHARDWAGNDDERPLSDKGRRQVERLRTVLPVFWLDPPYVASAPLVRCVDTVSWAGEVVAEDRLSWQPVEKEPALSAGCVLDLAAKHEVSVAGSQGGVVASIVETLRGGNGPIKERKGSAWVLSFADGRLVAADYLDAE